MAVMLSIGLNNMKITKLIKNHFRPIYDYIWKFWELHTDKPSGQYPIVIQGIQRSGTNYLTEVLMSFEYRVLNRIDPKRNNPCHKHCRWQNDKTTIVMDDRYQNNCYASSICQINAICGYPESQKHIVIFRSPDKWLSSIYQWGLQNFWFNDKKEFFDRNLHKTYLQEWDAYYAFWQSMTSQDPEQVLIVCYELLVNQPGIELERIDNFMGIERLTKVKSNISIEKVRHSKPISENRVSLQHPEIAMLLNKEFFFDWRRFAKCSN